MSVHGGNELYMDDEIEMEIFEADTPVAAHSHRFIEIAYVVRGTAVYTADGMSRLVHAGDYMLVDYGAVHGYQTPSREFRVDHVLFLPAFLDRSLQSSRSIQDVVDHYLVLMGVRISRRALCRRIWRDDDGTIYAIMQKITAEYIARSMGYLPMIRGLLIELLLLALRDFVGEEDRLATDQPDILDMLEWDGLQQADCHTLQCYAQKWQTSVSTLSRKFKRIMGCGYGEYLRRKRIACACRLLSNTAAPVSEIAGRAGYLDEKQFAHAFKSVMGMSPAAYRRAGRR